MRKTGRAKLDGSPGGRESGSIEEDKSSPANKIYYKKAKLTFGFFELLFSCEIGHALQQWVASRTAGIKYLKLSVISRPVNWNYWLFSAFMDMRIAHCVASFRSFVPNEQCCILWRNNKRNIMRASLSAKSVFAE